ncbi:MAG: (2Fe-2S) ferredoxin domain-containing protein [Gammaproteobacteria bacterium]|nr:(2Fe-2S) ferredoxin domain-containing protein [Gammaproteobacteria bacterium]
MSYYRHHLFFCTNKREGDSRPSCENCAATRMRAYAKAKIMKLGMSGKGGVRINSAGCLDRCDEGPVLVIYPEGTWYTYVDQEDIDELIEEHVVAGRPVPRLML